MHLVYTEMKLNHFLKALFLSTSHPILEDTESSSHGNNSPPAFTFYDEDSTTS